MDTTESVPPSSGERASSVPPAAKPATRAVGRRPRAARFARILLGITALMHVPFAFAVTEMLSRVGAPVPWLFAIALSAVGVALFRGRVAHMMNDTRRSRASIALVDIPYYVHWSACLWSLIPFVVASIVFAFIGVHMGVYMWIYVSGLVVAGYGVLVRRTWFVVRDVEIRVQGLPEAFDGYRIAQLSDLHIGALTPRARGMRWVKAANARDPDCAVVTGDLVTNGDAFYGDVGDVVGALRAKDGVFVSMGNHDFFGPEQPLVDELRAHGAIVLRNEGQVISRGESRFWLAALDDTWTRRDDLERALAERPEGVRTVLLSHDPDKFPEAAKHDVDVVLSGHTHGGQIAMPFLGRWINASKLAHHFHIGLYKIGRATLYVHPGLGTTGPPIRIGVAPAVVMITLRSA